MQLQKSFKSEYTDELKYKVRNRQNLADYALETFPLENPQTMALRGIPHPEGLLEQLIPEQKADFQNAITLYEAYPTLTPLIASDESFWACLTHVDLFPFVQKRWAGVKEKEVNEKYILEHWFMGAGITNKMGNALASLWWCVNQTIDRDRENEYELTKMLFSYSDIRQNLSTSNILFANREITFGILETFISHPEILLSEANKRNRFIIQSIYRLGGVKKLSYMDRSFIMSEIDKNMNTIMNINSETEIKTLVWK